MSEHTPGPWGYRMFCDDTPHFDIGPLDEDGRVDIRKTVATTIEGYHPEGVAQAEIDARLIAAAPDLLAALRGLASDRPDVDGLPCWCWVAAGDKRFDQHSPSCLAARRAVAGDKRFDQHSPSCLAARRAVAGAEGKGS